VLTDYAWQESKVQSAETSAKEKSIHDRVEVSNSTGRGISLYFLKVMEGGYYFCRGGDGYGFDGIA
jgi:hypothetical protein